MPLWNFKSVLALATLASLGTVWQPAVAQDYPAKPVRMVIPFAAGGGTDVVGRIVAQDLSKRFNQQFFVENRPGAAAQLGTDHVAKSAPDGYTLLWTVTDGLSILPAVKASVPYKIPDDFVFIAGVLQLQFAVSVNAKVPAKTLPELIAYAKANPGKLNFGSAGVGSAPHLGIALMNVAAGLDMVHVPFTGTGPALQALAQGTVDLALITTQQAKPYSEAGTLRVLAVTGNKRDFVLPDVPTLRESGLDVATVVGYGLSAPVGTPPAIVEKLKQGIASTMKDKAILDRLKELGYETDLQLGDAYRDFILKDLAQWRAVAKAANIQIDK
jgi:tripartite-type tricarboxylate transporter receptor subunit TctC